MKSLKKRGPHVLNDLNDLLKLLTDVQYTYCVALHRIMGQILTSFRCRPGPPVGCATPRIGYRNLQRHRAVLHTIARFLFQFLAETYCSQFETNTCTQHITSQFYMFVTSYCTLEHCLLTMLRTRKLIGYRKDDRTMRPVYMSVLKNFCRP